MPAKHIFKVTSGDKDETRYLMMVPPEIRPGVPTVSWSPHIHMATDVRGKHVEAFAALMFNAAGWLADETKEKMKANYAAGNPVIQCPKFHVELFVIDEGGAVLPPPPTSVPAAAPPVVPVRKRTR